MSPTSPAEGGASSAAVFSEDLAAEGPRRCAVLGSPIGHSLSPVLHRAAYAALGLTGWSYQAFDVDEAVLPAKLTGLDASWRGLSLTMPLKRVAIGLCDTVTPLAREVHAVNTVVLATHGITGSNTDVGGVAAALREQRVGEPESAAILGVGATAGSALAGLGELGVRRVHAYARDPGKAELLAAIAQARGMEFRVWEWAAVDRMPRVDVLLSTVPAAATRSVAEAVAQSVEVIFDAVYDPWPTPLAMAASKLDRVLVNGFDLLVHQAALQVEAMTGRSPAPLAAMRSAGEAALAERRPAD